MATWQEVGQDNRTAAHELFLHQRWRSCVSRAYYAAYSAVTDALFKVPVTMPAGREGPHHIPLAEIVGYNLTSLREPARWRLAGLVKRLYDLRVIADYRPSVDVDEPEARIALGLMNQIFLLLERMP